MLHWLGCFRPAVQAWWAATFHVPWNRVRSMAVRLRSGLGNGAGAKPSDSTAASKSDRRIGDLRRAAGLPDLTPTRREGQWAARLHSHRLLTFRRVSSGRSPRLAGGSWNCTPQEARDAAPLLLPAPCR